MTVEALEKGKQLLALIENAQSQVDFFQDAGMLRLWIDGNTCEIPIAIYPNVKAMIIDYHESIVKKLQDEFNAL